MRRNNRDGTACVWRSCRRRYIHPHPTPSRASLWFERDGSRSGFPREIEVGFATGRDGFSVADKNTRRTVRKCRDSNRFVPVDPLNCFRRENLNSWWIMRVINSLSARKSDRNPCMNLLIAKKISWFKCIRFSQFKEIFRDTKITIYTRF